MFLLSAPELPKKSTCIEWSITRSTGTRGLITLGSPFIATIAERKDARSTTAGTPVKSCKITLVGLKGISFEDFLFAFQLASAVTSSGRT